MTLVRHSSIHSFYLTQKEHRIKPSIDGEATGKMQEIKGTIKQNVGEVSNNPELEADGEA